MSETIAPATEPGPTTTQTPLVEMRHIRIAFGGVHAVDDVTVDLYPGEVVGLVGGNGAGKSTLIRALSGAHPPDSGEILVDGRPVTITNPRDAKALGIETIYQTLALADNVDAWELHADGHWAKVNRRRGARARSAQSELLVKLRATDGEE